MKVLVTGGTGLVGSAVMRRLATAGVEAVAASSSGIKNFTAHGDLRVPGIADQLLTITKPDAVVHCAARLGGVAWQRANPAGPITDSLVMAVNVFEAAARARAYLVFLSSSVVYPVPSNVYPASEGWEPSPEPQYRGVGGMKVYLESLLAYYVVAFPGFHYTILRPTAVYGPGDRGFADDSGHVVPDLLRRADCGEVPLVVWGRPNIVRDFVYVDDVADAVYAALLLRKRVAEGIFNVGSGQKTTIGELAEKVMLAVHGMHRLVEMEDRYATGAVLFDASRPTSSLLYRQVSIERARAALDWFPAMSLDEGLKKTLAWWRAEKKAKALEGARG